MSAEQLAERIGVSPATIYRYEKTDISNMGIDKLKPIAQALATTPGYLLGWDDDDVGSVPGLLPVRRVKIPLLGDIAAGEPITAESHFDSYIEADADIRCDFCLRITGDSMEPLICYGDIVFIRQQDDVDDGEIAAVLLDDCAALKRVYHIPNGLQLVSENARKYPPRLVTLPYDYDSIRIIGKAVAYKRIL